ISALFYQYLYLSTFTSTRIVMFVTVFHSFQTATTEIYTLSLHDALPIWMKMDKVIGFIGSGNMAESIINGIIKSNLISEKNIIRSEEHTSELQSRFDLVCRLLLEKKKINTL